MTEYGKKIANAITAVRQMYSDCQKLLSDCDGTIGAGKESIYGKNVTRDLSWSIDGHSYMAYFLYRYYDAKSQEKGLVNAVNVLFYSTSHPFEEPLLLIGQIKYRHFDDVKLGDLMDVWDFWNAYFKWNKESQPEEVLFPSVEKQERIEWIKLIAVPLYSIENMDRVEELMARIEATDLPE